MMFLFMGYALADTSGDRSHYRQWYPQFKHTFTTIAQEFCKDELQRYRDGETSYFEKDGCLNHLSQLQCASSGVNACLLKNTTEDIKANMAAAAVVLGLLPTTVSLAGFSVTEIGLLALKRPVLASFLATGCPAASPIRAFEYREPIELLRRSTGFPTAMLKPREPWGVVLVATWYTLGMGAVANLLHVSWELGALTVISFSSDNTYQPLLWCLFGFVIHLFGTITARCHLTLQDDPASSSSSAPRKSVGKVRQFGLFVQERIGQEFKLSHHRPVSDLRFKEKTPAFFLFLWITSTGTIVHSIYGTLLFSGTLFIGTQDAILVVFRYFLSTIVCRIVLMMAIGDMSQGVKVSIEKSDEEKNGGTGSADVIDQSRDRTAVLLGTR